MVKNIYFVYEVFFCFWGINNVLFLCVCLEFYFFGVGVIRLIDFLWLIRINRLVIILVLCFVKLVISINIVFGVGI